MLRPDGVDLGQWEKELAENVGAKRLCAIVCYSYHNWKRWCLYITGLLQ